MLNLILSWVIWLYVVKRFWMKSRVDFGTKMWKVLCMPDNDTFWWNFKWWYLAGYQYVVHFCSCLHIFHVKQLLQHIDSWFICLGRLVRPLGFLYGWDCGYIEENNLAQIIAIQTTHFGLNWMPIWVFRIWKKNDIIYSWYICMWDNLWQDQPFVG